MTINRDLADLAQSLAGGITTLSELVTAATSGIVESNANFIDTCLVGSSVDGKAWAGKFENGSVWSSLMLATVETSGSDAEVNIWDLTTGTLASATPLATVTLTGATPTSIAASMGYVIVGTSDQGFHIVDPHGGSWAERTDGWPRSLTASTTPALTNNNVQFVCAGLAQQPPRDPRTAGPMPCFGVGYGAGADIHSIIKHDGNVYDRSNTVTSGAPCFISNGFFYNVVENSTDRLFRSASPIDAITAADWSYNDAFQTGAASANGADTALDIARGWIVGAAAAGLIVGLEPTTGADLSGSADRQPNAQITGTYNTGMIPSQAKLVALANSKTVDRSDNANTLTENGTVTEAAVETGAELMGYSGFSAGVNYLSMDPGTSMDFGTGDFSGMVWFKCSADDGGIFFQYRETGAAANSGSFQIQFGGSGTVFFRNRDGTGSAEASSAGSWDDGAWHLAVGVRDGVDTHLYIDGVLAATNTVGSAKNVTQAAARFWIGQNADGGEDADATTLALCRVAGSALSADQVRKIYEAEKGMFAANAKCLLQGASDAVLDARIDPLTGKYIVTQSDTQDIFDGLAIETERTIAAGGTTFEHGLLWGDAVAEINDANLFASTPATDQRQVNEMLRSLANQLPAGVDLSKAKAWAVCDSSATILASLNVESVAATATGRYDIDFSTPFKSTKFVGIPTVGVPSQDNGSFGTAFVGAYNNVTSGVRYGARVYTYDATQTLANRYFAVAFFGELENE